MKLFKVFLFLTVFVIFSAQNIRIQSFTFIPACKSDNQCLTGYFCNSSFICEDKCSMIKCSANTICRQGQCHQICEDNRPCIMGQFCTMGYCIDKCRYIKCSTGYLCQLGACVANFNQCATDKNCKAGFYCSKDFKCLDKCSKENYCTQGQICENGQCNTVEVGYIDPTCPQILNCSKTRPNETTCPTLYFFRKPDPVVCGVTKNGTLVDYPVQCYACKDNTIMYYFNVTCDKVPKNCTGKNTGKVCSDEIKCNNPRPDEKSCPNRTWIRQPDPLVCGVTKYGEYVDFPVECYACRSKNVAFYYNKTCTQVRKKATILTCSQVSCQPGFTCTDGKCIDPPSTNLINCTQPRPTEKDCPTIYFIREPDPIVCGVTKTGQLVNFAVQCYACKSTEIVSYYNTTCDQVNSVKCADVKCKEGQKYIDGNCVTTKWPVCQKDVKKQQCGNNRPTQQNCPLIYFFFPPSNIVCGITSTGERISYPIECYACKNTDVTYYYNNSCDQLSKPCEETPVASVVDVSIKKPQCMTDNDCGNGLSCQDKLCIDKCITTTCPVGSQCSKGNCIQQVSIQTKPCPVIKRRQGFTCSNGQCVDLCKDIICDITDSCVLGRCIPLLVGECSKIRCMLGYRCENGQCIDKCKNLYCDDSHTCVNGDCVALLY